MPFRLSRDAKLIRFPSADGLELEGRLTPGDRNRAVVLCHPHPRYGGSMLTPVIMQVEQAFQEAGYTTLAFNFRGVGGSEGDYGEGRAEVADVRGSLGASVRHRPLLCRSYGGPGRRLPGRHRLGSRRGLVVETPDFVVVGHVTLDEMETARRPGGAALYAALTAHRLGLSTGLLTSFGSDFPREVIPPELQVVHVPAARTTSFRHERGPRARRLTLLGRATDLEVDHLPELWKGASLVLLCPVANEVDPALAAAFTSGAVGAAVQGWMRARGSGGAITPALWEDAPLVIPHVQALFLSREDMGEFEAEVLEWFQQVPLGVVTMGAAGALLFVNGERYAIPADSAQERDATGAGDVYAAAFLIYFQREGDPWEAAAYAACAAACSVEAEGIAGIPDRRALEARFARYRARS